MRRMRRAGEHRRYEHWLHLLRWWPVQKLKFHRDKKAPPPKRTHWYSTTLGYLQPEGELGDDGELVFEEEANLVSSLTVRGQHAPVIDLDVPAYLVPSSTPGHSHLYIEIEMPWWRYRILLAGLALSGLLGSGYYAHSVRRRMTMVRKPGVKKPYQD